MKWPKFKLDNYCKNFNICDINLFLFGLITLVCIVIPISVIAFNCEHLHQWEEIFNLAILFIVASCFLAILSPIGYVSIKLKITNKIFVTIYGIVLIGGLALSIMTVILIENKSINLNEENNFVIANIKKSYNEEGVIPLWMTQIQEKEGCCGFNGPDDWGSMLVDKPIIEDVPLSCCIVKSAGCNLIVKEIRNVSRWIHTIGCKEAVDGLVNSVINWISYGAMVILIFKIFLVGLYFALLFGLIRKTEVPVSLTNKKNEEPQPNDEPEDLGTDQYDNGDDFLKEGDSQPAIV